MHTHSRDPFRWCETHPLLMDVLLILLGILVAALLRAPRSHLPWS